MRCCIEASYRGQCGRSRVLWPSLEMFCHPSSKKRPKNLRPSSSKTTYCKPQQGVDLPLAPTHHKSRNRKSHAVYLSVFACACHVRAWCLPLHTKTTNGPGTVPILHPELTHHSPSADPSSPASSAQLSGVSGAAFCSFLIV